MECDKKTQAPKIGQRQLPRSKTLWFVHEFKKKVKIRKNNILKLA